MNFMLGKQCFQTFRKKCNLHSNPFMGAYRLVVGSLINLILLEVEIGIVLRSYDLRLVNVRCYKYFTLQVVVKKSGLSCHVCLLNYIIIKYYVLTALTDEDQNLVFCSLDPDRGKPVADHWYTAYSSGCTLVRLYNIDMVPRRGGKLGHLPHSDYLVGSVFKLFNSFTSVDKVGFSTVLLEKISPISTSKKFRLSNVVPEVNTRNATVVCAMHCECGEIITANNDLYRLRRHRSSKWLTYFKLKNFQI
ncbi:hypothetical protein AGLY_004959 [Aphis glycines]|uniref:Uncharacterized protein n=1 Tax=Aphis glycines TaxID=307491 RepID=A0A6G0TW96_APHGL|nr:hypothetical protein AGLY_004959 [Aphis glycines]